MKNKQKNRDENNQKSIQLEKQQIYGIPSIQFQIIEEEKSIQNKNDFKKQLIKQHENKNIIGVKFTQKIIYDFNESKYFQQFQKQKRQAFKKEWKILKQFKQKINKSEDQQKNTNNDNPSQNDNPGIIKLQQNSRKINFKGSRHASPIKIFDAQQLSEHSLQKQIYRNKPRSKTQVFIYSEDNKCNPIISFNIKNKNNEKQQSEAKISMSNKSKLLDRSRLKQKKDNNQKKNLLQDLNQRSSRNLCHQLRQICKIQLNTDENLIKRKSSIKSEKSVYLRKNQRDNKAGFNTKKNNYINVAKSVMVQKIINLRKSFNDKYNNNDKQNQTQYPHVSYKKLSKEQRKMQNRQLVSVISCQNSIQNLPLPQMNYEENKKMSFQQLFNHQKKKMEILKKLVYQNSQVQRNQVLKNELNEKNQSNFQTESCFRRRKSLNQFVDNSTQQNAFQSQYKVNNHLLSRTINTELLKQEKQYIQNGITKERELFLNISSLQKKCLDKGADLNKNKNSGIQDLNYLKRQPHSHITTYNFDHIKKKSAQKSQIKELRHKYLRNNDKNKSPIPKRRFSRQECRKYGISIVSVLDKTEDITSSNWNRRQSNQGNCFQIQKGNPFTSENHQYKYIANFQKLKSKFSKKFNTLPTDHQKRRQSLQKNFKQADFQPWQDFQNEPHPAQYGFL